jgi:hypothetical protein
MQLNIEPNLRASLAQATLHFQDGVEVSEVIVGLASFERGYSELVWLDAALEDAAGILRARSDESWHRDTLQATAQSVLQLTRDKRFDATFAVRNTRSSLRVASARAGGSWVIDLVGKLNPIQALESLLRTIRDWKAEATAKQLENSRLAQEVVKKSIENRAGEIAVLRDTLDLLREADVDERTVQQFVATRVDAVFPHAHALEAVTAKHAMTDLEITVIPSETLADVSPAVRATLERARPLLDVWSEGNRMLPDKSRANVERRPNTIYGLLPEVSKETSIEA